MWLRTSLYNLKMTQVDGWITLEMIPVLVAPPM